MLNKELLLAENSGDKWYYYFAYDLTFMDIGAEIKNVRFARTKVLKDTPYVVYPNNSIEGFEELAFQPDGPIQIRIPPNEKLPAEGEYTFAWGTNPSGSNANRTVSVVDIVTTIISIDNPASTSSCYFTPQPISSRGGKHLRILRIAPSNLSIFEGVA